MLKFLEGNIEKQFMTLAWAKISWIKQKDKYHLAKMLNCNILRFRTCEDTIKGEIR